MTKHTSCLDGVFGHFLRESNLHGVKFIGSHDRNWIERAFWIITVFMSLAFSIYMVEELFRRYNDVPIIISFQPQETSVAQIPFPALTLCNVNILKTQVMRGVWDRLNEDWAKYAKSDFKTLGNLLDTKALSEHMAHYCLAAPSLRRILNATLVDYFGKGDYINDIQEFLEKDIVKDDSAAILAFEKSLKGFSQWLKASDFALTASHACEDMILKCMWDRKLVDCDKVFTRVATQHGSCCSFNMMPVHIMRNLSAFHHTTLTETIQMSIEEKEAWANFTEDNLILHTEEEVSKVKYPKHQRAGGKPFGLSILVNPELDMYSTCNTNDAVGFQIVAHSPISYPSIRDYGAAIPPSSEVFIDIEPQVTTASEDELIGFKTEKRSCYFPKDGGAKLARYKFYTTSNCMDECLARLTREKCDCIRYFMPRLTPNETYCGAKKLSCSEEVRRNLTSSGKTSQCMECKPACTEVKYKMRVSHMPIRDEFNASTFQYETKTNGIPEEKTATNYSILHVFMGTDSLYAKERKRLYDNADLLASTGGLLSLTLGFSIISLVELVYFCTLRVWFHRKEKMGNKRQEDSKLGSHSRRRVSSIITPSSISGIGGSKAKTQTGYYNWAMTATTQATTILNVKSNHEGYQERRTKRKIPTFELLKKVENARQTNDGYMP